MIAEEKVPVTAGDAKAEEPRATAAAAPAPEKPKAEEPKAKQQDNKPEKEHPEKVFTFTRDELTDFVKTAVSNKEKAIDKVAQERNEALEKAEKALQLLRQSDERMKRDRWSKADLPKSLFVKFADEITIDEDGNDNLRAIKESYGLSASVPAPLTSQSAVKAAEQPSTTIKGLFSGVKVQKI